MKNERKTHDAQVAVGRSLDIDRDAQWLLLGSSGVSVYRPSFSLSLFLIIIACCPRLLFPPFARAQWIFFNCFPFYVHGRFSTLPLLAFVPPMLLVAWLLCRASSHHRLSSLTASAGLLFPCPCHYHHCHHALTKRKRALGFLFSFFFLIGKKTMYTIIHPSIHLYLHQSRASFSAGTTPGPPTLPPRVQRHPPALGPPRARRRAHIADANRLVCRVGVGMPS